MFLPYNFYIFTPAGKHEHRHKQFIGWTVPMKPWVVSKTLISPFSVVCTLQTSPGSFSRSKFQSPWKECFSNLPMVAMELLKALRLLLWCGSWLKNTMNIQRLDMCLRRRHATDSLSLRVFCLLCPKKKPTTQREGLHQWFANLRGTCPSTWVRKCYHVPVFPVQMSGAQVCSLPIRITGLWNPLFRLPRSWDANQGLRGHAMVSCTRAFVGVHPLWQGLWSTGERVDEWWWMFSFWVSEMFQFWYILIICIFAILGTLVWLFVSGCWRLGTGLHHGCGSYPGDPARNCCNV